MRYIIIILIAAVTIIFSGCLKHKTEMPVVKYVCDDTVSFSNEILPQILTPNCNTSNCHSNTSFAGGYEFTSYTAVNGSADLIFKTMNHSSGVIAMPIGGNKLSDSLVAKFECWISQGKLNN